MKRDMELIRLSLPEVEREEPAPDLSGYTEDQNVYHRNGVNRRLEFQLCA